MAENNLSYAFTWLTKETNNMFGQIQPVPFLGFGKFTQEFASAASAAETSDKGLTGAPHYSPVAPLGTRLVRGVNYVFLAEKTQATNPPLCKLVIIEVNRFDGKYELVKSMERELF